MPSGKRILGEEAGRRHGRIQEALASEFRFKQAGDDERAVAIQLREDVYREDLGRLPENQLDQNAFHLIAVSTRGDLVATFRILGPDHRPFDFENSVDVLTAISADARPAVIGGLCVRREFRTGRRGLYLQLGALKLAYEFCLKHDFSDLFLYTYSNLITFYEAAFFRALGRPFEHAHWGRVLLMHANLRRIRSDHKNDGTVVSDFLFGPVPSGFAV